MWDAFTFNITFTVNQVTHLGLRRQRHTNDVWNQSEMKIFEGHNGISAAIFAKENLLNNVLSAIHQGNGREEWLQTLPRALVAGFVKTDIEFRQKVGPLRCWPGGLCLSRSIGDTDVCKFIVPVPHVKQVKLSNAEGRLIIAADGIWDALSSDKAAQSCSTSKTCCKAGCEGSSKVKRPKGRYNLRR